MAPSILAYDPGNLRAAVEIAEKGNADIIHLDVLDGHFAPNISFGAGTITALRRSTRKTFDAHLMVDIPRVLVHQFIDAGSDVLIFQAETIDAPVFDTLLAVVRAKGCGMGLALKPETPFPAWAESRLGALSRLLILTVNPGWSGQKMDRSVLPKLEKVSRMIDDKQLDVDVIVDGGIDAENVAEVASRGANVIVAGAGIYGRPDPVQEIQKIRERATRARGGS